MCCKAISSNTVHLEVSFLHGGAALRGKVQARERMLGSCIPFHSIGLKRGVTTGGRVIVGKIGEPQEVGTRCPGLQRQLSSGIGLWRWRRLKLGKGGGLPSRDFRTEPEQRHSRFSAVGAPGVSGAPPRWLAYPPSAQGPSRRPRRQSGQPSGKDAGNLPSLSSSIPRG